MRAVVKRFGPNTVLDGIDLDVARHQVVCLIGASGSGKSTLLRCVNGLEAISSGTIAVDGRPVVQGDVTLNRPRRDVGMVLQALNLFPRMNAPRPRNTRGHSWRGSALPRRRGVPRLPLGRRAAAGRHRACPRDGAKPTRDGARDGASEVCYLHEGCILEEGRPEELFTASSHARTAGFLGRTLEAGRP